MGVRYYEDFNFNSACDSNLSYSHEITVMDIAATVQSALAEVREVLSCVFPQTTFELYFSAIGEGVVTFLAVWKGHPTADEFSRVVEESFKGGNAYLICQETRVLFSINVSQEKPMSVELDILSMIRRNTGLSVVKWAENNGTDSNTVRKSACGSGIRRIRVIMAVLMNKRPSELWLDRGSVTDSLDDFAYENHNA